MPAAEAVAVARVGGAGDRSQRAGVVPGSSCPQATHDSPPSLRRRTSANLQDIDLRLIQGGKCAGGKYEAVFAGKLSSGAFVTFTVTRTAPDAPSVISQLAITATDITSVTLKDVHIPELLRKAGEYIANLDHRAAELSRQLDDTADWDTRRRWENVQVAASTARHAGIPVPAAIFRPGCVGHPDRYYASFAARYVKHWHDGKNPTGELAREAPRGSKDPYGYVRGVIRGARNRGLLTRPGQGKTGGELTEKAIAVLKEVADPVDPQGQGTIRRPVGALLAPGYERAGR